MKITFPRLAEYDAPIEGFLKRVLPKASVIVPPRMTKRTLELGARHSPDGVCAPFKYNMGNFLESLELGADVIMQTGTGCRAGYYGEVQEKILKDLGYEFRFVNLSRRGARPANIYKALLGLGCALSYAEFLRELALTVHSVIIMDKFAFDMRENMAYEDPPGAFLELRGRMIEGMRDIDAYAGLRRLRKECNEMRRQIRIIKPPKTMRVGIVGELYTVMEPFSNYYIEDELIKSGVCVSRKMSAAFLLFGRGARARSGYLKNNIGATASSSVAQCESYARAGYDGILHMKSSGCTPEINAMPMIAKISRDYKVPVLTLSFDTGNSEVGLNTRLEAFVDMIRMRNFND